MAIKMHPTFVLFLSFQLVWFFFSDPLIPAFYLSVNHFLSSSPYLSSPGSELFSYYTYSFIYFICSHISMITLS